MKTVYNEVCHLYKLGWCNIHVTQAVADDDEYESGHDTPPVMKKPATAKQERFNVDGSDSDMDNGDGFDPSATLSDDEDTIKRDKNVSSWFGNNEKYLSKEACTT